MAAELGVDARLLNTIPRCHTAGLMTEVDDRCDRQAPRRLTSGSDMTDPPLSAPPDDGQWIP
jgi:hypothetical protein